MSNLDRQTRKPSRLAKLFWCFQNLKVSIAEITPSPGVKIASRDNMRITEKQKNRKGPADEKGLSDGAAILCEADFTHY